MAKVTLLGGRMDPALPLLAKPNQELGAVDPVEVNLLVGKGVPSLADLDIPRYVGIVDGWARDFRKLLPANERNFRRSPASFKNDIHFFRLVVLHWYIEEKLGIAYNEDQRDVSWILYTNPSDLFLNGVIDTRRGTCGNMAALFVALCWRLKWPVSLACVKSHSIARYEKDGVVHNIEATQCGYGGAKSDPDDYIIDRHRLSPKALGSGSDLRSLTPRQTLGVFYGHRARHHRDCGRLADAEQDYLLARYLFPNNHRLYQNGVGVQIDRGAELFDPGETGHPLTLIQHVGATFGSPQRYTTTPLAPQRRVVEKGDANVPLLPLLMPAGLFDSVVSLADPGHHGRENN